MSNCLHRLYFISYNLPTPEGEVHINKKVLIFNSLYFPDEAGGAEHSVKTLAEGLFEYGIKPVVVTTSTKPATRVINGVKVYYIKTRNLYWMKDSKRKNVLQKAIWHTIDMFNPFYSFLKQIVKEENPAVIHTNNLAGFSVYIWKMAKELGIPLIHTIRDHYLLCIRSTMFKNGRNCEKQCSICKFYSAPKKFASAYVDVVVGISKFILSKHLLYGFFRNAKKEVIYNTIDMEFTPRKTTYSPFIKLGYAGLLAPEKGIEFLLASFINLKRKNLKLLIFGRGVTPEYEFYLKRKYKRENIYFMGYRKDKDFFNEIDIMVVPSLVHEAFGRVAIEANFQGIPVLASNRGALLELIKNGENGMIFNPEKEGDFEQKLSLVISMLKENKFKFDPAPFSKDYTIKQYLKIYNL